MAGVHVREEGEAAVEGGGEGRLRVGGRRTRTWADGWLVDKDGHHAGRVSAMISSVLILIVALPRSRPTAAAPRPPRRGAFARRILTPFESSSSPAFSRI